VSAPSDLSTAILEAMRAAGARGATDYELSERLGVSLSDVRTARYALSRRRLVRLTGASRGYRHVERVWCATDRAGVAAA
jgi:hypothetical protein